MIFVGGESSLRQKQNEADSNDGRSDEKSDAAELGQAPEGIRRKPATALSVGDSPGQHGKPCKTGNGNPGAEQPLADPNRFQGVMSDQ